MTPSSFINWFPYWIERLPNAFVAHMDDFPDFTFTAPSVSELIAGMQNAFLETLEQYLKQDYLPVVHSPLPGEEVLVLTPTYAAKVMLILAFKQQNLSTQDFAYRVGCLPQEGSRLLKLTHPTKIDTLHAAFAALNVRLYCSIEDRNPPKDNEKDDDQIKSDAKTKKAAKSQKPADASAVPGEEAPKKKRGRKPRPRYDESGNPIIYTRPTHPPKKPGTPRKPKTPKA